MGAPHGLLPEPQVANEYAGEVIEASISQFRCFAPVLNHPPAFGSFVRVGKSVQSDPFESAKGEEGAIYGLVCQSSTSSQDPNRKPSAFGLDDGDLEREQPQIFELLATEFSCLIVAHVEQGCLCNYFPPKPPPLHARVFASAPDEIRALTTRFDFLRNVINLPDRGLADDLIAASFRLARTYQADDREFILRACKEIAVVLGDQYDRLTSILRKIRLDSNP